MALTRAQLLMGNSGQGALLTGQPQGVIAGIGITINANGTIDVNSQSVQGIMKLGQTTATANAAYNAYEWPTATGTVDQQLTIDSIAAGVTTLKWKDPDMIPWTTLGQLVVGTGANSQILLNAGTNGQILIVDTSAPSGLAYTSNYVSTTGSTGAANIPAGTTVQQPATPGAGALRYNTNTTSLEFYNSGAGVWETVASSASNAFVEKTSNTGSAIIPAGTDLQRDTSPATGYLRVNTTTGLLEFYNAGAWNTTALSLTEGLGIDITSNIVKAQTPIQTGPPAAGLAALQAIDGSVYWDNTAGFMFVRYNDGTSTQWVQVTPVTSVSGATGSFTSSDGKTVNVSNGLITSIV